MRRHEHRGFSSADYILEWKARGGINSRMVAPWRHENPLVQALYFKQRMWEAAADLRAATYPSDAWDLAYDSEAKNDDRWRELIIDAWQSRFLERGGNTREQAA